MTQRAILCPRCRRLIGSDEAFCSWCGTKRSSAWWQAVGWTRGALGGDWLVKAIISVNIGIFVLSLVFSRHSGTSLSLFGMFSPGDNSLLSLGATGTIPIERDDRVWTLLSANYLHGGLLHILFNMLALRQIAPSVIQEYGTSRMFVIYTLGGVFGYIVSYLAGVPFTIGASAAICALIGALLYFGRSRGGVYGTAVYREVSGWVISLAIFGLIMPGINNWAHGGGIVGGVVLGMLMGYGERRPETSVHTALAMVCAVATILVLGWAVIVTAMLRIG
ncbi:MAG: rhomboid family intramembrane serine protease [Geobacter sp.]|nr:MAG: rhomboid family intramembrane serine protease [Geobacter sp.]